MHAGSLGLSKTGGGSSGEHAALAFILRCVRRGVAQLRQHRTLSSPWKFVFFFFRTTVMSENAVAAAMSTKSKSLMAAAVIEVSPLVMRDRLNRCLRSRQLFPAVQQQRC